MHSMGCITYNVWEGVCSIQWLNNQATIDYWNGWNDSAQLGGQKAWPRNMRWLKCVECCVAWPNSPQFWSLAQSGMLKVWGVWLAQHFFCSDTVCVCASNVLNVKLCLPLLAVWHLRLDESTGKPASQSDSAQGAYLESGPWQPWIIKKRWHDLVWLLWLGYMITVPRRTLSS